MSNDALPPDFCLASQSAGDRPRQSAYKPKGVKYPSAGDALEAIGQPTLKWTYSVPWSKESTWVLRYDKPDGTMKYRVITQYKGGWYVDQMPPAPYPLYFKNKLLDAETVYVFGNEGNACEGRDLGFVTTTSLAAPLQAAMSDWSPLEEKHVVIVRDFDDTGLKYAEEVAQLVLDAGAHSAKIVTLPGLNDGEGIQQWIGDRCEKEGKDVLRAEIEAMALAAPLVERQIVGRQTPPVKSECAPPEPPIELQRMSEVVPETLEWVWASVIPQGALSLITGEPGVGKSLLTLEVAAAVTRGDRGPHDESQGVPAAVILFSSQDDLAKTIRPRLEAAGANVSLIYALSTDTRRAASAPADMTQPSNVADGHLSILEAEMQRLEEQGTDVRLVVIDTFGSFAGLGNQNSDVQIIVSRLARLAARMRVAIAVTSNAGSSAVTTGSIRETPVDRVVARTARSVWTVVRDLDDPKRRLLIPVKTNLCEETRTLAYSVRDGAIQWEPESTHTSELERATEWLREQLSASPVFSKLLDQDAKENDITPATLRRARCRLKAEKYKDKTTGRWMWGLPIPEPITS